MAEVTGCTNCGTVYQELNGDGECFPCSLLDHSEVTPEPSVSEVTPYANAPEVTPVVNVPEVTPNTVPVV